MRELRVRERGNSGLHEELIRTERELERMEIVRRVEARQKSPTRSTETTKLRRSGTMEETMLDRKGKTMEEHIQTGANIFAEAEDAARKIKANFRTLRKEIRSGSRCRPYRRAGMPGSRDHGRCAGNPVRSRRMGAVTLGTRPGTGIGASTFLLLAMAAGPLMHWYRSGSSRRRGRRHGRGRLEMS